MSGGDRQLYQLLPMLQASMTYTKRWHLRGRGIGNVKGRRLHIPKQSLGTWFFLQHLTAGSSVRCVDKV